MHKKSRWLKAAGIKSETEGFIIAAIDQTIKTNYYRCKILKNGTVPVCRIIMRSIPGNHWPCRGKVPWSGQNWIPTQIQQDRHIPTLEHININTKEKWYDHEPQTVTEKENITISWDMPIQNRSWDDDDDDDHHNDHYQDDDNNDNSDSIIYYLKTNKGLDLGMEPSICKSWLSTPFPRRNIFNQPFVVSVFPLSESFFVSDVVSSSASVVLFRHNYLRANVRIHRTNSKSLNQLWIHYEAVALVESKKDSRVKIGPLIKTQRSLFWEWTVSVVAIT